MRTSSQYTLARLRRIHEFLSRSPVTVAMGDLKLPIERLDALVQELDTHGSVAELRRRASQAGTARIRMLAREARFEYMRPLANAARLHFRHDRELRRSFAVRRSLQRPGAVIDALRGMADMAAPYKAEFIALGCAEDFIERMHATADALAAAIDARARELGARAGASVGSQTTADTGRLLVRFIDSMVAPRLAATPSLLAEWRSLQRQGRVRPVSTQETTAPEAPGVIDSIAA